MVCSFKVNTPFLAQKQKGSFILGFQLRTHACISCSVDTSNPDSPTVPDPRLIDSTSRRLPSLASMWNSKERASAESSSQSKPSLSSLLSQSLGSASDLTDSAKLGRPSTSASQSGRPSSTASGSTERAKAAKQRRASRAPDKFSLLAKFRQDYPLSNLSFTEKFLSSCCIIPAARHFLTSPLRVDIFSPKSKSKQRLQRQMSKADYEKSS